MVSVLKNKLKIIIYDNKRIIVNDYINLKDIRKEVVVVDSVCINGKDLIVKRMDDYFIEIVGTITNVVYQE